MTKACKGCPKRYLACQDTCTEPEVVKAREQKKALYQARKDACIATGLAVDRQMRRDKAKRK